MGNEQTKHDCSICQASGKCGIESKVRWFEANREELLQSMTLEEENVRKLVSTLITLCPIVSVIDPVIMAGTLADVFALGFYCGANRIPPAFKVLDDKQ